MDRDWRNGPPPYARDPRSQYRGTLSSVGLDRGSRPPLHPEAKQSAEWVVQMCLRRRASVPEDPRIGTAAITVAATSADRLRGHAITTTRAVAYVNTSLTPAAPSDENCTFVQLLCMAMCSTVIALLQPDNRGLRPEVPEAAHLPAAA
jgi:hypothetical protein